MAAATALVGTVGALSLGSTITISPTTDLARQIGTVPTPEPTPVKTAEPTEEPARPKVEFDRAPAKKQKSTPPAKKRKPAKRPKKPPLKVPATGPGTFDLAEAPSSELATSTTDERTFTVEVEDTLPFDLDKTATQIRKVLDDERSWKGLDGRDFRQVDEGPDIRIVVATPGTTDEMCAPLETNGEVSCRNGDTVILNADRWGFGIDDYKGALNQYRTYLVNHEVGHALGNGHEECPGAGEPAPVMQQQTYGLKGCSRNPWPTVS